MPRPANPDVRARLLAAGVSLIHTHGFNGTGVKEITDLARVPKGSFYSYYASKELFAAAAVEHYWASLAHDYSPLLSGIGDTTQRLRAYFHALADEHAHHDFTLGCLIANLALETAGSNPRLAEQIRQILRAWERLVADCLLRDRVGVEDEWDAAALQEAAVLIEAWEGAVLRGKAEHSRAPYDRFEQVTLPRLLASIATGSG